MDLVRFDVFPASDPIADPQALDADTATLMHFAMICSDDPPRSLDELETAGFGRYEVLLARNAAALYVEMCDLLDLPELPARFDLPVTTDVPVLVLSGGLDVQTPTFVSQSVVDQLPNATHFVFPAGFHVQVTSVNECAIRIAREFIADPSAPPGFSCVTQARPLSFLGPDLARSDSTTLDP